MLQRGRVIKADAAGGARSFVQAETTRPERRARVLDGRVYEARLEAERIVAEARERARALVEAAERESAELRSTLEQRARANAAAELGALAIALREREARLDERALERSVQLAALLAERLLGKALELDPALITALARQALSEARAAGSVRILAHPDDARNLEAHAAELGLSPDVLAIVPDGARARGDLRLETELGVLDAALAPQLGRLASKLGEALRGL